jgi:Asp-tRNA(Asn)/Glu-tRNA(Gln) amidotransferase A subunit family amidase
MVAILENVPALPFDDYCAALDAELDQPGARRRLAQAEIARLNAFENDIRAFVSYRTDIPERHDNPRHPLAGALVGVKDIILTRDFPTRYGSPFSENEGPRRDAWCVQRLSELGAQVVGKTVSTEFAFSRPGATQNPHDRRRTPGGSSSGSAAAVAAGFVSFALGSQTGGSVIRPASYCGIVGFKPTFGLLPLDGVHPASTTLDHLGLFARSPRDAWLLTNSLLAGGAQPLEPMKPRRLLELQVPDSIPLADQYKRHLEVLAERCRVSGISIESIELPVPVDDFVHLQELLCYWEASRILLNVPSPRLTPELAGLLEPYLAIGLDAYADARRKRQTYQSLFDGILQDVDAIVMPSAIDVAPEGLGHTGDAALNRFWTSLHLPVASIPLWTGTQGLPLGLQMIGALGRDRELLACGEWMFRNLGQRT